MVQIHSPRPILLPVSQAAHYNHQLIERETSWHMTRRLLVQIKSRGVLGRAAPRSRHFRMYSQNRAERVDQ